MPFVATARLRTCLRLVATCRAAVGVAAFVLGFVSTAPAWSACLTSTLTLAAAPYTNSQCITPPVDNDGIDATGSTYTLNNSGAITVQSAVPKASTEEAIRASSTGDLTVINSGALSVTAAGTAPAGGIQAFQTGAAPTGTVTIINNGPITLLATGGNLAAGLSASSNQIVNVMNASTITGTMSGSGFLLGISGTAGTFTCTGGTCTSGSSNAVVNVTNSGTIVLNAPGSTGILASTQSAVSSVNNITNTGTIIVNGAGSFAIWPFAEITPATCPIASCTFTFGPANVSNQGQITAGPNAFLFFTSVFQNNPINLITNAGVLDGQFRNPAISAATFTENDLTNAGLFTISYAGAGLQQIIDGKFTQTSSGTLGLRVNAAGQHDFLTAQSVSLGGTLLANNQPGNYANVTTYLGVVQSTAAITTRFDNLAVANSAAFFTPTATYNTNSVDLTITRQPFGLLSGLTFNERAVGNALEAGFGMGAVNGPGGGIYTALFDLSTVQQAANAYDQLSGEIHASAQSIILEDSLFSRETLLSRMRQQGFAAGTGPMASLEGGGPTLAYAAFGGDALAYAGPRRSAFPANVPAPPRPEPDLTFWAQGLGAWGRINSDGNAADVRDSLAGLFTGVDRRFGDWRAGIAAGYTNSALTIASRASSASIDAAHFAAYAGTSHGAFNLRTGADFAWNNISTNRAIAFPGFADAAFARYGAGEAQLFGELGYGVNWGKVAAEPFGGLAYVHLSTNSFTETGGIAALAGRGNSQDVGYSTLGARVATTWQLMNGMTLVPRASAAWQHAIGNLTPSAALAFQSIGTPFTINGAPIAREAALVSAGADLRVNPRATVGFAYLGQLASNAHDQSIKGTFDWKF